MARMERSTVDVIGPQSPPESFGPVPSRFPGTQHGRRGRTPGGANGAAVRAVAAGYGELGRLSPLALELVEVAAMFDETFRIDDLAAVLDEPVGPLLLAVREVLAAGVVVARGETLAFRRAETRAEIYATVPEPLRVTLHRTIGTVLLDRGGCDDVAAAQLVKGARPGDRAILAALDDVAAALVVRSSGVAADLALHVLELSEITDELRFARAATAVEALVAAKRVGPATELARKTLALPRVPAGAAARLRLTLCAVQLMDGDPDSAVAEGTALLGEGHLAGQRRDGAELVRLLGLLALGNVPAAEATADAVLAGAERPGTDATLGAGLSTMAWVAWCRGHLTTALDLGRAAALRSAHSESHGRHPALWLGAMLTALGEFDEAAEVLDRAAEEVGRPLDTLWEPVALLLRGRLHLAAGRLDEAVAAAQKGLALAKELGTRSVVPVALATLAQVAILRGELEEAARHVDRIEPGPAVLPTDAATLTWTEAQLAAARHGAAAVLPMLTSWWSSLPTEPILLLQDSAAAVLTRTALAAGDLGMALEVVVRAEQLAAGNAGLRSVRAAAEHARGLLDRNAAQLDRAAAGYPRSWSAASAHEDAGALFAAGGDQEAACTRFEQALGRYGQAGAERDAARVRSKLRKLGVRSCHWARAERPDSGWESVTDSERRVAKAVAEGLTNRQAAERLFLSRHTVDFHLRQIFLKLGIRSRVELTRLVLQEPADLPERTT
jgi:DNA-binding CsgD family transcriptional regulator/predicted negative regulator of RcsB-dependent stress response